MSYIADDRVQHIYKELNTRFITENMTIYKIWKTEEK